MQVKNFFAEIGAVEKAFSDANVKPEYDCVSIGDDNLEVEPDSPDESLEDLDVFIPDEPKGNRVYMISGALTIIPFLFVR